jgi:drug/metabolite transporter (DMT)-like permease
MKVGMQVLSPYHVAALRILSAGIVLIPFAAKAFKQIPRQKLGIVVLSGLLGSFFPAFLFCLAETQLSSALTGMLNSLTPLCAVLIGVFFFQLKPKLQKVVGILIGLVGLFFLVAPNGKLDVGNFGYVSLVLFATVFYAVNVNLVGRYMQGIASVNIAAMAFVFLIVPCVIILGFTGYFAMSFSNEAVIKSTLAACILGVVGTAFASVLFYRLVKRAGALFAAMVTYGIPFIALAWGYYYGESITVFQIGCLGVILIGVYISNRSV